MKFLPAAVAALALALIAAFAWIHFHAPAGEAAFGRLEKASDTELLDVAAGSDPTARAAAFYHLGMRAHRNGDRRLCEEFLARAVEAEKTGTYSSLSAYELAKLREAAWRAKPDDEKPLAEALDLYRRFLGIYKGHAKTPYALHRAALLHAGRGEHDRAAECFDALLKDWPEFPDLKNAVIAYAGMLTLAGRTDACEKLVAPRLEAWKNDPVFAPRALLALAFAREMAGRRDAARAGYERIAAEHAAAPEAEIARNTLAHWARKK